MERLKELISQLLEQVDRKADPSLMLQTTQQLEAELKALAAAQPAPGRVMPTKITVMMPSAAKIAALPSQPASPSPAPAPPPATNGTPAMPAAAAPATNGTQAIPAPNGISAMP